MFICYSTYRLEAWDRAEHNFLLIELMLLVEWRSALLVGELFDASAGPFHKTRSWTLKFNSFCRRKHNVQKKNKFSVYRKKFTKINRFWDLEKSKREKVRRKMSSFMITNADMNTATQETYKAINSQITQNNGTWSLTQTSQGLSFSGNNFNHNANFSPKRNFIGKFSRLQLKRPIFKKKTTFFFENWSCIL